MNHIPKENRRESYNAVKPTVHQRQTAVIYLLAQHGPMTAQEVADQLYHHGFTISNERNLAAPRITELRDAGKIEAIGKKPCVKTGRNVTLWALVKEDAP